MPTLLYHYSSLIVHILAIATRLSHSVESPSTPLLGACPPVQASYLPKPGAQLYQFRYVNRQGRVCGQSPPFQFREPRPMDELVTLEEADGGSDILLVVPKATVLQNQLDESQQERNDLMQLKLQLEDQVAELRSRVQELETTLSTAKREHLELTEQYKGISRSHGELTEERDILSQQQGEHVARILELEDDIQTISDKVLMKEVELDRYEYLAKASTPSPCFRWTYLLSVSLVSLTLHNLIQGILFTRGFFLPALVHLS
ncbi:Calcium-binding and coiled-coil domain-containing protein 1 [Cricetulus griseus]|uniref:Calcium-binding and coiled-coil domain-containing protein 1 n=1 Tax=Cricetulus griseus TaxID=10029 RepID=G3HV30_CRIGR|nr:Calcium-binding and coiled-coil domain-containing protein 1 [Cricetulus griseus]